MKPKTYGDLVLTNIFAIIGILGFQLAGATEALWFLIGSILTFNFTILIIEKKKEYKI